MDKTRLVNLSDATFAIVLTLLVVDIHFAEGVEIHSSAELAQQIFNLSPLFVAYTVSFAVLAMFWTSHNFFYEYLSSTINRQIILLNMLFLATLSLIPFSARLLGEYPGIGLATAVYGLNVFLIGFIYSVLFEYALASHEIDTEDVPSRILKQSRIRRIVTSAFSLLGIALSFVYIPAALVAYAFPIIFNTIPGTLNAAERLLGIKIM